MTHGHPPRAAAAPRRCPFGSPEKSQSCTRIKTQTRGNSHDNVRQDTTVIQKQYRRAPEFVCSFRLGCFDSHRARGNTRTENTQQAQEKQTGHGRAKLFASYLDSAIHQQSKPPSARSLQYSPATSFRMAKSRKVAGAMPQQRRKERDRLRVFPMVLVCLQGFAFFRGNERNISFFEAFLEEATEKRSPPG